MTAIPNLADPRSHAEHDLAEVWRGLRSGDPVHWQPETEHGPGFWAVTRHRDVSGVLRDPARFTSERGNVLVTLLHGEDAGSGRMLAVTDGPRHTELRRLLLRAFAPRALEGVVRQVRRTTRRLLVEALEKTRDTEACDFAQAIASYIPLATICDLLDVPAADRDHVLALTRSALASDYERPEAGADRAARGEILLYFTDLVRARRRAPGADVISLLATADLGGGGRLGDEDIVLNCYSLIMGGDETSRLAMIGAVRALIDNPDQWRALRRGDVTVESAAEEVLRWTTPTMHFGRVATSDVELCGRTIAAGDVVTLWLASANRDESVFAEPDRFDLARSPNPHLSLGYGPHFCLGAYLGRVEISTVLDALRTFVSGIDRAGPERRIYSNFLSGLSSLPVTMRADPSGPARWTE
ncbi:cytochrome P450 [Actinomadura sp. 9N215]|uniref:cytochrome P450 n=1 Tax=Actinomadura sp. 9N215 TaxID=3375150 RepID=UPI00379426B8